MSTTSPAPVLPQGAGYGVVVGIGFFFAVLMAGISVLQVCLAALVDRTSSLNLLRTNTHDTTPRPVKNSTRPVEASKLD